MAVEGLLLDFGSVVLRSAFDLRNRAEANLDLPPGSLAWAGPFDPANDPLWRAFQAGAMTERDYWGELARLVGVRCGRPGMTTRELFHVIYDPPGNELVYPEAEATIHSARRLGIPVVFLTNDLDFFTSREWRDSMPVLDLADAIVDGTHSGLLKPDRRAFEAGRATLDLPFESVLFVDDQRVNIAGAEAVGLQVLHFDVTAAAASWAAVRALLLNGSARDDGRSRVG